MATQKCPKCGEMKIIHTDLGLMYCSDCVIDLVGPNTRIRLD